MESNHLIERVNRLIESAEKSRHKGNYLVYAQFKQRIPLGLSTTEYEDAVRRLASALRV